MAGQGSIVEQQKGECIQDKKHCLFVINLVRGNIFVVSLSASVLWPPINLYMGNTANDNVSDSSS